MKVSLIAFDLDGTILRGDKTVSERSVAALRAARERGALIVPATGRIYKGVPAALREPDIVRYLITINGALVYDAREDAALSRAEIPCELALRVMEHMDTADAIYDCYQDGWGYVSRAMYDLAGTYIPDPHIRELFLRSRTPVEDLKRFIRARGRSVQKLQMHFCDPEARARELALLPRLFPELLVCTSVPSNIEINVRAANKGDALLALCGALGIPREETVAFGDGLNDVSLMEAAGLGVAMANAEEAVLAAADTVCPDNEHDGVAAFLEELLAISP